jgi:hypothetical protein
MPTSVHDATQWRSIKDIYKKDASTWQRTKAVYVKNGATWEKVHEALSATVSASGGFPLTASGSSGNTITTASADVTAAGGWPAYSYSWVETSYSGNPLDTRSADNPSSSSTTFSANSSGGGGSSVFRCTITDTLGSRSIPVTIDVNVNFNFS